MEELIHGPSSPPTPKLRKKVTLDSMLFDESGKLNPEVVKSLAQIKIVDESLRASMLDISQGSLSERPPRRSHSSY